MEVESQATPNGSQTLRKSNTAASGFSKINSRGKYSSDDDVNTKTIDLTPSEDFDESNVTTKPQPRLPVEPTFRGWKEVGGWGESDALTADDELEDLSAKSTVFDQYLPAVAYGDWYHNTGYLIVGGLLSWFVGWFRFSLAPIFFIMIIFATLYRTSIRKYRTTLREQAQREFSIKSIENDYETMDWLNVFLEKFWYFLEPSISQIVTEQANPILASSPAPGFIKQLWIDSFTAGTKPFRIDCVKTLPGTDDDIVVMDWGCSFTPNALADASNKQIKNKVNQKVIVKMNLFGVIPIQVAVSDVSFKAILRVRMRMMTSFPHIETVNVSLLEPPQFDFTSRLLGDSIFNWEVLSVPGLYLFINEMVKKYAGPILITPLSFQLNIQQLMAGNALDSSIGVLAVTAKSATGLRGFTTVGNTLDPYLNIGFQKNILATTKHVSDTSKPVWKETHYILVKLLSEPLNITVVDHNGKRKDRDVGTVQFDLELLIKEPKQSDLSAPFLRNNKPVGRLQFGLNFMPTIEPQRQADGAVIPAPDLNTGIARIEVTEARHLRGKEKGMAVMAELYINNEKKLSTAVQKGTKNPSWGAHHEEIIANRSKAKVRVVVKNPKTDKVLGQVFSTLNNFIDAAQVDEIWFPLKSGGEVRINTSWKPVGLTNASGSGGYSPPIGVVRVSIDQAEDLRNLETIGKVDPYVRLLVNGFERSRTMAEDATLNPTWNEIHYVSVSSANQKLTIEVMDVERRQNDRTLGLFDVKLNEIINKNEQGKFIQHEDNKKRVGKLIHKRGPKGTVTYSLSFYPTLPVKTLEEIKDEKEAEKQLAEEMRKEEEEKKQKAAENGEVPNESKEAKKEEPTKKASDDGEDSDDEEDDDQVASNAKMELSLDELVEYQHGVFVFELIDGTVSKEDVYLHVYFDNHGYNDFVTQKITKRQVQIGNTGDVIIKELDWSKACFRISKNKQDNRLDKAIAELTIPTVQLIKNGYHEPTTISLKGTGNASFKIQTQWIPVIYDEDRIPPQDSVNNSGILHIEALRATDLPSGDSNGKSDPYVKLYLNTNKDDFFKSKKVKKTLNPTWNEQASVEVLNLYDSVIKVVAYDWDIGPEQDDLLSIGYISLKDIDPMNNHEEFEVELFEENGDKGGIAYFKADFRPEFLLNVKASTANVGDTAFGAVGAVGGLGKGAVKGIGGGAVKGLGGGAKFLKKGLHLGKTSEE